MKKYIVITSVNDPSEAILRFREWAGWHLVVVGDRKSPVAWDCPGVTYLNLEQQYARFGALAKVIPENSYKRKTLGYVYAIQSGAEVILESDDDNIPYANARETVETDLAGSRDLLPLVSSASGWINAYREFGAPTCWPRGYPLDRINQAETLHYSPGGDGVKWGVLQYLADEDPDVDAIFRLTRGGTVSFAKNRGMRLGRGVFGPFNSQATVWVRETFPFLFLPLGVTDRVTDILRGYMALPCLWQCGYTLAYASPIVHQVRNEHNLLRDFELELDLYRFADRWCQNLATAVVGTRTPAKAFAAAIAALALEKELIDENAKAYDLFLGSIL